MTDSADLATIRLEAQDLWRLGSEAWIRDDMEACRNACAEALKLSKVLVSLGGTELDCWDLVTAAMNFCAVLRRLEEPADTDGVLAETADVLSRVEGEVASLAKSSVLAERASLLPRERHDLALELAVAASQPLLGVKQGTGTSATDLACALVKIVERLGAGAEIWDSECDAILVVSTDWLRAWASDDVAFMLLARGFLLLAARSVGRRGMRFTEEALIAISKCSFAGTEAARLANRVLSVRVARSGEAQDERGIWLALDEMRRNAATHSLETFNDQDVLAGALINFGKFFIELGRKVEARPVLEEAVAAFRRLTALNEPSRIGLARALANLAQCQPDDIAAIKLSRHARFASELSEEAVAHFRLVLEAGIDVRQSLALELVNLANTATRELPSTKFRISTEYLESSRLLTDRGPSSAESWDIIDAVGRDPGAFRSVPHYAFPATVAEEFRQELARYGRRRTSRLNQISAISSEALKHHRSSMDRDDTHRANLAKALVHAAESSALQGQHQDAFELASEAVDLHTELRKANPGFRIGTSSAALRIVGQAHFNLNRTDAAWTCLAAAAESDGSLFDRCVALRSLLDICGVIDDPGGSRGDEIALLAGKVGASFWESQLETQTRQDQWSKQEEAGTIVADITAYMLRTNRGIDALTWLARTSNMDFVRTYTRLSAQALSVYDGDASELERLVEALSRSEPSGVSPAQILRELREYAPHRFGKLGLAPDRAVVLERLSGAAILLVVADEHSCVVSRVSEDDMAGQSVAVDLRRSELERVLKDVRIGEVAGFAEGFVQHQRLKRLVETELVEPLRTLATGFCDPLFLPLGLTAWLPISWCLAAIGFQTQQIVSVVQAHAKPRHTKALVVYSCFSGQAQQLRNVEREARAVAEVVEAEVLSEPTLTPERFLESLPEGGLLHLACHGAAHVSNPAESRIEFESGVVSYDELALRLRDGAAPAFVNLNACQLARSGVKAAEQSRSLAALFLAHGSATVIASLWNLRDEAAAFFSAEFYGLWKTGGTVGTAFDEALRLLERACKERRILGLDDLDSAMALALLGDRRLRIHDLTRSGRHHGI